MTQLRSGEVTRAKPLFELGQVVATPGALACLEKFGVSAIELLRRHQAGDWGVLTTEDKQENALSVERGLRVLSNYPLQGEERIWVITEADRSVTTLLLPDEY